MKLKLTMIIMLVIVIILGGSVLAFNDELVTNDGMRITFEDESVTSEGAQSAFDDIGVSFDDEFFDWYTTALTSERVSARVVEVGEIIKDESIIFPGEQEISQRLVVEILEGEMQGRRLQTTHFLAGDQEVSMGFERLREGDRVYVIIDERGETPVAYVDGIQRQGGLLALLLIFVGLILIIGRVKGIQTIIALAVTVGIIFIYTLPALFNGNDPIFTSVISCIAITIISFIVISGLKKKTLVAIFGTVCGFIIAGVLAIVFSRITRMSGLNEDSMHLLFIQGVEFNLVGLMFAGIIIGALGVCMDVAMSIASALWELKKESPKISTGALFTAGMNIGKDAMGTMSSTLILAYVGSLITVILIFMANSTEFIEIINIEMISEEIIRGLTGSIGLVTVIPITSYVAALLYNKD